jgi:hypothetical protein
MVDHYRKTDQQGNPCTPSVGSQRLGKLRATINTVTVTRADPSHASTAVSLRSQIWYCQHPESSYNSRNARPFEAESAIPGAGNRQLQATFRVGREPCKLKTMIYPLIHQQYTAATPAALSSTAFNRATSECKNRQIDKLSRHSMCCAVAAAPRLMYSRSAAFSLGCNFHSNNALARFYATQETEPVYTQTDTPYTPRCQQQLAAECT